VRVDGRRAGQTPVLLSVSPGAHSLTLRIRTRWKPPSRLTFQRTGWTYLFGCGAVSRG
jgi:hypothetical protein